jgi:RNA polymerase sigma factor (sigma-70 family)
MRKCERDEAEKRFVPKERLAGSEDEGPSAMDPLDNIPPDEPLNRVEERQGTKLLVEQAMRHLGEEQRKVFELVKRDGYSQIEAAEKLGISQATVSRRQASAIERLRNILGHN